MNDNIMMSIISGDGNLKDGSTTMVLLKENEFSKSYQLIDIKDKEDFDKLNTLLEIDSQLENKKDEVLHIDVFKEYINKTRSFLFNEQTLKKFNSNNEDQLFTLFASMGNIVIQNGGFATIIYLPKYINDEIKRVLFNLTSYSKEESFIEVKEVVSMGNYKIDSYMSYDDFIKSKFPIIKK